MSTYLLIAAGIGLGLLIALRGIWNLAQPVESADGDDENGDHDGNGKKQQSAAKDPHATRH
jgi:hypothetical protein